MKQTKTNRPKLSTMAYAGTFLALASIAFVSSKPVFAGHITAPSSLQQQEQALLKANPGLNPNALSTAFRAYANLRAQGKDTQQVLTLIDYTKASKDKRLWVINMKTDKVEYNTLVAQGKNSGTFYAKHFSNARQSDESSIGVYLTGKTYVGEHGRSLRLHGLDKGFNSNAFNRDVVMHSAWYVSQSFAKTHGRVGRSWGCPALSKTMEPKVVNAIKNGTVMVAYYPNQAWLHSSPYLT